MLKKLGHLFAPALAARRALARIRPRHYTALGALRGERSTPLADLPSTDVERINARSDDYFDAPALIDFWTNKPMSDFRGGPDSLWRLGLLLGALQIGPGDRVLDFGCGTGWTSVLLAQTGADVTGMDISTRALAVAATVVERHADLASRLRFQPFDGTRIAAPDAFFDIVVVFDALHHLPNLVAVLAEFSRVLGPHGYLGFAEPGVGHAHSYTSSHETELGVLENEIDPEQLWTAGRSVGFRDLELLVPPIPASLLTVPMRRARWFLQGMPGIVPHDFTRQVMLAYPSGILRKGPYTSSSLHPHALLADIRPAARSIDVQTGQRFAVEVAVRNLTGTVWLHEGVRGRGAVSLGARLLQGATRESLGEAGRVPLPDDVGHGVEVALTLRGVAPSAPGEYVLRLDMHDEGIAWFSERGSAPIDIALRVR